MAELTPTEAVRTKRISGRMKGKLHVPDDFDAELPAEVIAASEGR